ncbi:hypothetical protein DTO164E3_4256 [Paecilomyces variotii]|nr:hypothetical protein DTO032I3_6149 [Paecilomyces variotii]KAJ9200245.1 hypothetical protein DTO164E3_4256 [Paecilomyces variotii]KAJ9267796.1 hypothetical protein DTO195F2_130 [Paecilomyces variotii]KAJ9281819.1 hypothetical protein DTO021D3_1115 [Paecilomyces variotii]KAJ9347281.1 hypothetical protein DTO027B6_155 [Paecilomyces variotii]
MDYKSVTRKLSNINLSLRRKPKKERPSVLTRTDDRETVRKSVLESLTSIYKTLEEDDDGYGYFLMENLMEFPIECADFMLEEIDDLSKPLTTCFFQPCSSLLLEEYPISPDFTEVMKTIQAHENAWLSSERLTDDLFNGAGFLSTWLTINFSHSWRAKGQEKASLQFAFTKWKPTGFGNLVDEEFEYTCFYPSKREPRHGWYDLEGAPHVMLTIAHRFEGKDECLLRGELLAIIAVMITRLRCDDFAEHSIIPVMIFSFMGRKGRILQAHTSDRMLIIRKSKLYDFSTLQEFREKTSLFLRYLTSQVVGDTQQTATGPVITESQVQADK